MNSIGFPFEHPPAPGDAIDVAPGVKWISMPLPLELDHINLYLLEDSDGWFIVDTGIETQYFARLKDYRESWQYQDFFRRAGLTAEATADIIRRLGSFSKFLAPVPPAFRRIEHGDCFGVNGHRWCVICSGGHSPEHACLHSDSLGVMISGDQVLPCISSNVSYPRNGGWTGCSVRKNRCVTRRGEKE